MKFGFKRNKHSNTSDQQYRGERATYRQVAVTPAAHAKLRQIAERRNKTIIETVNDLLDV